MIILLIVSTMSSLACRAPEDIARDYLATKVAGPRQTAEAYLATAQASGVVGAVETAAAALQTVVAGEGTPVPVQSTPVPNATIQPTEIPTVAVTYGPDARPNLSIVSVEPVQVVEGTPLVLNKATAIKVVVRKEGPFSLSNVEVVVFNDGVSYKEFFVYDDNNFAYPSLYPRLLSSNLNAHGGQAPFPLSFEHGNSEKIVYFFADGFAPASIGPNYYISAQVDMSTADAQLYNEPNIVDNHLESARFEVLDSLWARDLSDSKDLIIYVVPLDFKKEDRPSLEEIQPFCNSLYMYSLALLPVNPDKFEVLCNPNNIFVTSDDILWSSSDEIARVIRDRFGEQYPGETSIDVLVMLLPDNWGREGTEAFPNGMLGYAQSTQNVIYITSIWNSADQLWNVPLHELGHLWGLEHKNPCTIGDDGVLVTSRHVYIQEDLEGKHWFCDYMKSGSSGDWTTYAHYMTILVQHTTYLQPPPVPEK